MVNKSKSYVRTQEGEEEFLGHDLLTFPRGKLTRGLIYYFTTLNVSFRKPHQNSRSVWLEVMV
mgnify:CR=1 FL=1